MEINIEMIYMLLECHTILFIVLLFAFGVKGSISDYFEDMSLREYEGSKVVSVFGMDTDEDDYYITEVLPNFLGWGIVSVEDSRTGDCFETNLENIEICEEEQEQDVYMEEDFWE